MCVQRHHYIFSKDQSMYLLSTLSSAGSSCLQIHEKIYFAQLVQGPCSCVCRATASHTSRNFLNKGEYFMKIICQHVSKIPKRLLVISGFCFQKVPCEQRCLSGMAFSIYEVVQGEYQSRSREVSFRHGFQQQTRYATDRDSES